MTSAVPDMPLPDIVNEWTRASEPVEPVWMNQMGGVTYRLGTGTTARYVKWQPANPEISLEEEAVRLTWVNDYTPSPRVLAQGSLEGSSWLVSQSLSGENAVSERWLADPAVAVQAVGRGLRQLHDRLPTEACPWSWDPATRVANARQRGIEVDESLLASPDVDRLVVCHGDACCPNTILVDDGTVSGHVDFGSMGLGDRWADIAVAAMSACRNYGPEWEDALVGAYGLPVDRIRMDYYQALWNAT